MENLPEAIASSQTHYPKGIGLFRNRQVPPRLYPEGTRAEGEAQAGLTSVSFLPEGVQHMSCQQWDNPPGGLMEGRIVGISAL